MDAHLQGTTPIAANTRRAARRVFALVLGPALIATILGAVLLWPAGPVPTIPMPPGGVVTLVATVTDPTPADPLQPEVAARGDDGPITVMVPPEYLPELHAGDRIRVVQVPDVTPGASAYVFQDFVRGPPMGLLAAVFVVLVVVVARWRGLASLLGLGIGLAVVWWFTLPALLVGRPAMWVGLVSAAGIMFATLYLAHGFTLRTSTALVGTLVGLAATAALAAWASGAAHLTGLSDEYALDLRSYAPAMQLRSVLL
ncbi:MAG TPA: YibE/F family protein, partial [Rugosimonospora sp.]|nr:YibE/F family protein [Rugosimonospora sp.]